MNNYDQPIRTNTSNKKHPKTDVSELTQLFVEMTSGLYVIGIKLKGFHWNMIGNQFFPVHACLDGQIDAMFDFADGAAEIIRQLNIDTPAPVNMLTMIKQSPIREAKSIDLVTAEDFTPIIVDDYSQMIHFCAEVIKVSDSLGRQDVSDFAIKVRQFLDKYKWQFEASIKSE